jgi:DNA modification methylase
MSQTIINGDSAEILKQFEDNSIDAVVTDPPYGIEFLGKEWDQNTGAIEIWRECLRVLKPGGHLLAFSAARTYHHLATNIESVGFEIRDQIMWIYASGFPKAQDIGKAIDRRGGMVSNHKDTKSLKALLIELFKASGKSNTQINKECGFNAAGYLRQHDNGVDGWGYALPLNDKWHIVKKVLNCSDEYDKYFVSSERQVVGTKESGCFDQNFKSHTIGARSRTVDITQPATEQANHWHGWKTALKPAHEPIVMARKPMRGSTIDNVLRHGVGALNIDATRIATAESIKGARASMQTGAPHFQGTDTNTADNEVVWRQNEQGRYPSNVLGEIADYQKYFYCPKVSRRERHRGFEHIPDRLCGPGGDDWVRAQEHQGNNRKDPLAHIPTNPEGLLDIDKGAYIGTARQQANSVGNNHPTVKPVELMKYLIKLVTPPGSHILDPFSGSGSTGMACKELGRTFTGIDLDPRYCEIARKRIAATAIDPKETLFE